MKFLLYIICGEVSGSNSNSNTDRELVKSMSRIIVSRFGGDEAANSQEIKKAAEVLASDPARQYAIVSAPGSMPGSVGVTDMLYLCHSRFMNRENYDDILDRISDRFNEIVQGLGINFNVREEIDIIRKSIDMGMALDFVASRGEYITARIFAEYLGWNFIDAAEIIFFNKDGTPDREKTFRAAGERLKPMPPETSKHSCAVIATLPGHWWRVRLMLRFSRSGARLQKYSAQILPSFRILS